MLRNTLMQADWNVFRIGIDFPAKKDLGSTASLLSLCHGVCAFSQVGDSRVYLCVVPESSGS